MKPTRIAVLLLLLLLFAQNIGAQVIRIASLAPESTPWGQGLNRIAAEWSRITRGRIQVRIFHGGVAGDESDTIRKMRLGQIQGAVLTTAGLATVVPATLGLSVPGVIESEDELDLVLAELGDELNSLFSENGYEILGWSNAGWIKFFSTSPIIRPDDLVSVKIASGTLPEEINQVFRNLGMQPVPLTSPEILGGLNSGLIDTVIYAPLGVAGYQWFGVADNMLELQVAPFLGNILMDQRAWNRIPEEFHDELKAATDRIGREIAGELAGLERDAMELMTRFGLQVNEITPEIRQQWMGVFAQQSQQIESELLRNDFMNQVFDVLEEYRTR